MIEECEVTRIFKEDWAIWIEVCCPDGHLSSAYFAKNAMNQSICVGDSVFWKNSEAFWRPKTVLGKRESVRPILKIQDACLQPLEMSLVLKTNSKKNLYEKALDEALCVYEGDDSVKEAVEYIRAVIDAEEESQIANH